MTSQAVAESLGRQLEGRVAIVTGAGRGIGRGIAAVLASRGAQVCVTDLDGDAVRNAAGSIESTGGRVLAAVADVTEPGSITDAVHSAVEHFGKLDICVANAGVVASGGFESRSTYTQADWELTMDVNVLGLVHTADAAIPHMIERQHGRIVNISSQGGRPPRGAGLPLGSAIVPYLVSKAASIQLTHHQAIRLGQHNITVNAVCPGTVWTPMWGRIAANRLAEAGQGAAPADGQAELRKVFDEALAARHPLGREQTPEDIGRAVAFLASDDASQITGQALNVNGGAVMS